MGISNNIIVLLSPFFIMYILSMDFVKKIYDFIFEPLIYSFNLTCLYISKLCSKIINI